MNATVKQHITALCQPAQPIPEQVEQLLDGWDESCSRRGIDVSEREGEFKADGHSMLMRSTG